MCDLCHVLLMRIAHHRGHAGKRGNLFRGALRVASRHDNLAIRILPMNAPDCGARILVR